jgi:LysM repeat protein
MHNLEIKGEFIDYLVRKGDSLWKIANRFGTTAKIIQSVNQLNNTHLRIGQILKIPKETIVDKNIKSKTPEVTKSGKPARVDNKT